MSLLLTAATIEILKNFSRINETLLFPKGSTLVTRSVKKNTYAEATVSEVFPKKFTIYNLNEFLSVIGQFDKPTLTFDEANEYVKIHNETGGLSVKYQYGDEATAYIPDSKKKIELPSIEVTFKLSEIQFKSITNLSKTLGAPDLALVSENKLLKLVAFDAKNTSISNTELEMGKAPKGPNFKFVWKIEHLEIIPGTYEVSVSKEGISRFKHESIPLVYHITLDANATKYNSE